MWKLFRELQNKLPKALWFNEANYERIELTHCLENENNINKQQNNKKQNKTKQQHNNNKMADIFSNTLGLSQQPLDQYQTEE